MPFKDPVRKLAYQREYYARRRAAGTTTWQRARRRLIRDNDPIMARFFASGCLLCGESHPLALAAHHRVPADKQHRISELKRSAKPGTLRRELRKCVPLCHNCHAKVHGGVAVLDER